MDMEPLSPAGVASCVCRKKRSDTLSPRRAGGIAVAYLSICVIGTGWWWSYIALTLWRVCVPVCAQFFCACRLSPRRCRRWCVCAAPARRRVERVVARARDEVAGRGGGGARAVPGWGPRRL